MVEGTVFVEEGPPSTGFRCGGLEAGLRPRDPGGARFADANAQRFHYHVPKAPPEQSKGGSEWGTDDGHWHSRPLVHDDQNWVLLPGMSFDNFDDFLAGCEAYANARDRSVGRVQGFARDRPAERPMSKRRLTSTKIALDREANDA